MQWGLVGLLTVLTMSSIGPVSGDTPAAAVEDPAPHPDARNYFNKLSDADKGNIRYVISTLSNSSLLSLLTKRGTLQRRGDATGHIHPLRYMLFVLTDRDLREDFRRLDGRPWSDFKDGFSNSFVVAYKRNNIDDKVLKHFCDELKLDLNEVKTYVSDQEWKRFMNFLQSEA